MDWTDTAQYPFEAGKLFLGHDNGREVGIKTERHALTIAGAGAGKGVAVIIPNLLKWPHNALVIDPKGESAEATAEAREAMGQAVHVIDPFNSSRVPDRFHASYNPLDEIDPDALTVREDIEAVSDGIIMRPDASAAHWDDGAQSLVSGLIAYVISAPECEGRRNLIEVRKILMDDDRLADTMQNMRTMDECAGLCREGYAAVFAKEGGYFVSNAQKNTRWLDSRGMADTLASSSFSLADLKTGKTSVYLVLPANYLGQHGRFLRLFVRCGIEAMARKTPRGELRQEQCLFLLDEFFSLGYIDEISKAAGLMRGYGLQLWPILQDLGQLITLYGREGSETFFANADVHQFFGNTDQLTLEQISTRLGVKNMEEIPLPPAAPLQIAPQKTQHQPAHQYDKPSAMVGVFDAMMEASYAHKMATHQDEMQAYQREMAQHGRPRISPDEVALLIQKKDDVVADNMICFVHGREPLLISPSPYFRDHETPQEALENKPSTKHRFIKNTAIAVVVGLILAALVSSIGWLSFGTVFLIIIGSHIAVEIIDMIEAPNDRS